MKTRFNTFDIICGVTELQKLVGLRVHQVYDIDNKTYLFRLQGGETKTVLLLESGTRFHTTAFDWPKNVAPSGFSMKLRKHLKNKRLERLQQLGSDRIVDFQFGMSDAAYHVILELYDRGNVILTDHEWTILYILRPHYQGEEVRYVMREKYPTERAKTASVVPDEALLRATIANAQAGDNIRRLLMPLLDCGPAVIDHLLVKHQLDTCHIEGDTATETTTEAPAVATGKKKKQKGSKVVTRPFQLDADIPKLLQAVREADELVVNARTTISPGYVIQKMEVKPVKDESGKDVFYQNIEYHPYLFAQFDGQPFKTFDTFMVAVDEFYSTLESQKIDVKTLEKERDALKKLSNVKKDHAKRLEDLSKAQGLDTRKAELITSNQELVDNAILAIRSAVASQMSWPDIHDLVKSAQANGDPVASAIKQLKLEINHISVKLSDPYFDDDSNDDDDEDDDERPKKAQEHTQVVDVDLGLSAWANARKFYDQKRTAAQKEQKTIDASQKALKSAERKTQQTLKDVRTISNISKARKVYWFEKFYWFISSENYLVIGGRDAQQNELIVKRYMRPMDIYVHAEIQGASSVVVRNPSGEDIPPKTLLEAGTMAISYSVAWDAKVVTNAYWVRSDQVSKTAPTGEYLGTGSFMVRGKKNFLPSCHLIMGLSLLFKLEDSFIEKHRGERRVRGLDDEDGRVKSEEDLQSRFKELSTAAAELEAIEECVEIELEADKTNSNADEATKSANDADDSESEDNLAFPDTQVKVEHDTGRIIVRATSTTHDEAEPKQATQTAKAKANSDGQVANRAPADENEEATIIAAAPARRKQQTNAKKRKEDSTRKAQQEQLKSSQQQLAKHEQAGDDKSAASQMKRGQKGKLKKIKSKYRDQDDEERELRMQILKSAGKDKLLLAAAVQLTDEANNNKKTHARENKVLPSEREQLPADAQQAGTVNNEADDGDDVPVGADVEMIDSLTGQPADEDELLFAIPVVAPYQALQSFKFKVKLTPGTGKRGRAAKTALTMFSGDKACNAREKDLLKSIREEALARNIPGKVKLSAPQLQKFRK